MAFSLSPEKSFFGSVDFFLTQFHNFFFQVITFSCSPIVSVKTFSSFQSNFFNLCLLVFLRFKCSRCGRSWPSNRVMVVFHMRLTNGQGTVKVRRFRQDCKMCAKAPMEMPSIPSKNIEILMENLVKKIRIKCYHEDLGGNERPFRNLDVNNPHEPDHCEACKQGFCKRS